MPDAPVLESKDCRCSFNWRIKNFTFNLCKKDQYLQSPTFSALGSRMEWYLRLYPNRNESNGSMRCYLHGTPKDSQLNFSSQMAFQILFLCTDGKLITSSKIKQKSVQSSNQDSYVKLKMENMGLPRQSKCLLRDTLIVQCQMWMASDTTKFLKKSFACTRIEVERRFFDWPIENFSVLMNENRSRSAQFPFNEDFRLEMKLYWNGNKSIGIDIRNVSQNKNGPVFVVCKISVVCVDMKLQIYDRQEHTFDAEENEEWSLTPFIPVEKLLENGDSYLQGDQLVLFCEFAYSTGKMVSYQEEKHFYVSSICQEFFENADDKCIAVNEKHTLSSDLINSYSDPKKKAFADIELLHGDRKFRAHKAILCARSTFFKKMFQNDMMENQTNSVVLQHGEADTTQKVLHFMYSDELEELNWGSVLKLYMAANFYQIPLLKDKCLAFLKSNLRISNVCEMLELAHAHDDASFKEFVVNYISANRREVLLLPEWNDIRERDRSLAEETLFNICLQL